MVNIAKTKSHKKLGSLTGEVRGTPVKRTQTNTPAPEVHLYTDNTGGTVEHAQFPTETYTTQTVKDAMSEDLQFTRFALRYPKHIETLCYPQQYSRMTNFLQDKMRNAVAYSFDYEISELASTFTAEHPEVMAALAHDVRLPFPGMIFASCNRAMAYGVNKFDNNAVHTRMDFVWTNATNTRISSMPFAVVPVDKAPSKRATILVYPIVYEFDIEPRKELLPPLSTMVRLYFQDMVPELPEIAKNVGFTDKEQLAYVLHLIGSASRSMQEKVPEAMDEQVAIESKGLMDMLAHMSARQPFWAADYEEASKRKALQYIMKEHMGHARALYGLLALLNLRDRISHISEGKRKPGQYHHRGNFSPRITEHAVTIRLPEATALKLLKNEARLSTGRRHKRHSVRGHWYNRILDRECKHVYEQLDPDHYKCARCDSKRTWKKNSERGDASLGWVTHSQYNVERR